MMQARDVVLEWAEQGRIAPGKLREARQGPRAARTALSEAILHANPA